MDYYKTEENHPVHTNCPQPGYALFEGETLAERAENYQKYCEEKTAEANQKMAEIEAAAKPAQDRQALIWKRAMDNAEKELIKDNLIAKE